MLCALALAVLAPQDVSPASAPDPRARVLFVTHSAGFTHSVVKRVERGRRAVAENQLRRAAAAEFVIDCTQDCADLAPTNLANYDVVMFYTTGELPVPETHRSGLIEFVENGGGFVGVHSATDTFYEFADYGEMIGGTFDGHPWHANVGVTVEAPDHPIVAHLGADRFEITDEIYQFRNWNRSEHDVLLSLDPTSVDVTRGKREDRDNPLGWCKAVGAGRMFYTALGHRPEVWTDPRFLRMVVAGLRWTAEPGGRLRRAPEGATVLFDGSSTDAWVSRDGSPCKWQITDDGALEVEPGSGNIFTTERWQDFVLHVEFRTPVEGEVKSGQGKGNSGVYLQRRYEVQILDSFGTAPEHDGCASLYRQRAPDVNVCRTPGEWQRYWIRLRGARFGEDGKKSANARITVVHNGVVVHDDVELTNKTGAGEKEGPDPLPLRLQDHGNRVQFRNVWIIGA